MKILIVHDIFIRKGGAEKVLLALINLYPNADVFIPMISKVNKQLLQKKTTGQIKTTFFSKLTFFFKFSSLFKPFYFIIWKKGLKENYDIVICSSHSFASHAFNKKGAKKISYIHSPPRYLYDYKNQLQILNFGIVKLFFFPIKLLLKYIDKTSIKSSNVLIANSKNVQNRILKEYNRQSILIYPPIKKTPLIKNEPDDKKHYYICMSQLLKQKKINLAIEACKKTKRTLLIVGIGPELKALKKISNKYIFFTEYISEENKKKVYKHAKALLFCSEDEDFGIVPLEAQSYGVPVIAYESGGNKETVIENITGILYKKNTLNDLTEAIYKFEVSNFFSHDCYQNSKKYFEKVFNKQILNLVSDET